MRRGVLLLTKSIVFLCRHFALKFIHKTTHYLSSQIIGICILCVCYPPCYVVKDKVKYFNAAPPSRIRDYLKEREAKLKLQEEELEKIIPSLELKQKLVEKGTDTEKVKSFYTRFNERVLKKGLKANIIFNETARGNIPNVGKTGKVKYLDQTTPAEILIYKNKTAIVLLEKDPLIILIRGESIANSFKAYFGVMWIVAKK